MPHGWTWVALNPSSTSWVSRTRTCGHAWTCGWPGGLPLRTWPTCPRAKSPSVRPGLYNKLGCTNWAVQRPGQYMRAWGGRGNKGWRLTWGEVVGGGDLEGGRLLLRLLRPPQDVLDGIDPGGATGRSARRRRRQLRRVHLRQRRRTALRLLRRCWRRRRRGDRFQRSFHHGVP